MSENRPSFPFYPKDWLPSTRGMSASARGYHIDMLSIAWVNGSCEVEQEPLRRSVGAEKSEWRRVWPELEPRWPIVEGRRINRKLERVRQDATAYTEAKRRAGQKGGRAAAAARAEGVADGQQNDSKQVAERGANGTAEPQPALALASADLSLPDGRESARADVLAVYNGWNDLTTAPLPKAQKLTKGRATHIRQRLREQPVANWLDAIRRVERTPFCRGENDRGWCASLDWLIANEDNVVKLAEGKYDRTNGSPSELPDGYDEELGGTPIPPYRFQPIGTQTKSISAFRSTAKP